MTLSQHVVASGMTTIVFYSLTHSKLGSLACFLSGILIDMDHLWDYYLQKKRICWRLTELMHFCSKERDGKLYLVFHSYELLMFLWVVVFLVQFPPVLLGVAVGVSTHLLIDQFANPVYPWAYFWFCRRKFGFSKKIFFHDDFIAEFKPSRKSS